MAKKTKGDASSTFKAFLIELLLYAVLVVAYFFLVLHFLADWVNQLEVTHIRIYALVAIALIVGQAVLLESVTTWLMRFLRGGRSE
jgi:hypothetical protein